VKFWGIGNEMWNRRQLGVMPLQQFEIKHNLFAEAMRRVDPTIKLIASGAMPDTMTGSKQSLYLGPADWTGGLFSHCLANMDLISEHIGSQDTPGEPLVDWMRKLANRVRKKYEAYQDYLALIPALKTKPVPICSDEWRYLGGPANSYKFVPAYAWTFNEMFRHSDLFQMACYSFPQKYLINANRTDAELNPAGLLFKLYRDHYGVIPVRVTGDSPPPPPNHPVGGEHPKVNAGSDTYPLDLAAALSNDRKSLTMAVVNPTESEQQLNLSINGVALTGAGRAWFMAPSSVNAVNVLGQPPQVEVQEREVNLTTNAMTIAPISVNIYEFPVK
jgi:alpha-N-arabinofuranosidase